MWRHFHLNQPISTNFKNKNRDDSNEIDKTLEVIYFERVLTDKQEEVPIDSNNHEDRYVPKIIDKERMFIHIIGT